MNGKQFITCILFGVVLLTVTLTPISSQQDVGQYDPWADLNEDGKIDIKDLAHEARLFGTEGTPINKTALLLELLSRVDALEAKVEVLEARIKALETPTKITIEAYPTTDTYVRYHALSIDEPLNVSDAWNAGKKSGYEFIVTDSEFTYDMYVALAYGSHFVEYAASGYLPVYVWHAKIYINNILKAEGDVGMNNHLIANFTAGN